MGQVRKDRGIEPVDPDPEIRIPVEGAVRGRKKFKRRYCYRYP